MRKGKKRAFAGALAAATLAAAAATTLSASASAAPAPQKSASTKVAAAPDDCAAQVTALTDVVTSLSGLPIRDSEIGLPVGEAPDAVGALLDLQVKVTALIDAGCLPAVPTDGTPPTECVDLVVHLQAVIAVALDDLIVVDGTPDPTLVVGIAADLTAVIGDLTSAGCLPETPDAPV